MFEGLYLSLHWSDLPQTSNCSHHQQIMCGVPPSSIYFPPAPIVPHKENKCGVPHLSIYFSVVCHPPQLIETLLCYSGIEELSQPL